MSADLSPGLHPVLAAVAAVGAALDGVADVDPVFMDTADTKQALLALSSQLDRVEELRMRVLVAADDLAAETGARDAAAWLAHHGRRDRGECRRRLRLAKALAAHDATAAALRDGTVTLGQAEVVVAAVDALPDRVDAAVRAAAEERLVAEAARFGPRQLRALGRRVVDVVAPEVADDLEGRLLADEETRARRGTFLRRHRVGDGTSEITYRGPDHVCDRLLTYLHAFTNPRRPEDSHGEECHGPSEDRRPHDQRLGTAFAAFLEAIDPARLPRHGGDATTILVTISLDDLRKELGIGYLGDEPIAAAAVRRLACGAGIIPVVLDGTSVVLDAGRTRRFFTPTQRKLLAVTQRTCRADGCDIPAAWCEAHHAGQPWAKGGRTDLADGLLLCSFHHHRAHDPRSDLTRHPDGRVRFTRRT